MSTEKKYATRVASFRLEASKVERLQKEAKIRKVNPNILVNQIIETFLDFDSSASYAGFMPFPKKTVKAILYTLSDETVRKVAVQAAKSELVDLAYMMKGKYTTQAITNTLLAWVRASHLPYWDDFEDGQRSIIINHGLGRKWSLFIKELLLTLFAGSGNVKISIEVSADIVVIQL